MPVAGGDRQQSIIQNLELFGSLGPISGVSSVLKFGRARDIDTGDVPVTVWPGSDGAPAVGNSLYTYSASAEVHYIASTDAGDTQTIEVQGLDANWAMQTIEVTLQGQTRVQIGTGETFIRCFRARNKGTALAGTVHIGVGGFTGGSPDSADDVRVIIRVGAEQTEQASYSIPAGYKALLKKYHISDNRAVSSTATFTASLRVREFGEEVFAVKSTLHGDTSTAEIEREFAYPLVIPAKADVEIRVDEVSANNVDITAEFDMLLVQDGALD